MTEPLQFTIPEIFSLIGVTQCVYILVYMIMRAGRLSRAGLPILYFTVLAGAFLSDFGARYLGEALSHYFYYQWVMWSLGAPLSVLMIMQIAKITETPSLKHYWVLGLVPAAFLGAKIAAGTEDIRPWLAVFGMIAGSVSLLTIWAHRGLFASITAEKAGKPRYWLILALIFTNIFLLFSTLGSLGGGAAEENALIIRTLLGLGFAYLVGTSLFRIYPQAVRLEPTPVAGQLTAQESAIAQKIESLLSMEKIYHEPAYSRADLARECGVSEAVISRIINLHFGKTFPQLLNERRIEDAKRLLRETDANIRVVAEEVGFNSLATFNRVFKEVTGGSPGRFREDKAA